jgi:uncharacterized protein involved in exopolysaccharide biosynthesis/Mrp family chromosome partitioning ATPase
MQTALASYGGNSLSTNSQSPYYPSGAPPHAGSAISLKDLLRVAIRYKYMIRAIIAAITWPVLAHQLLSPTIYRSTAHVQVELIDQVGTNQADVIAQNAQRVANAVRLHSSRSAAEHVIEDLDLLNDPHFQKDMGNISKGSDDYIYLAINRLLSMVTVAAEPNSDLLAISVSSRSPELAARIANQIPASVRAVRASKNNELRAQLLASLETEQHERGEIAAATAQKVAEFRQNHRMLVGAGGAEDLAQLNRIAAQAAAASASREGSAARSGGIAAAGSMQSTAMASSAGLDQLERRHADLVAESSKLTSSYGPNHPDVKRISSQIDAVEGAMAVERNNAQAAARAVAAADAARMAQMARSDAAGDAAAASRLNGILASVESKSYENVSNSVELENLVRESTLADESYKAIAARVEQVRAQMQEEGVSSSIVSPAVPNLDAIAPAPLKYTIIAFFGSSILAFLLAFLRDFLDDRLRTSAQIRKYFGLPTFGMLPLLAQDQPADDPSDSPVIADPQSLFAEVSRSMYCEIRSLRQKPGSQVVLVSSPLPGDGKSTVTLTLAAAGLAMGDRTLVLDLDLRKQGYLQRLQNNIDSPDLIDIITGQADIDGLLPLPHEGVTEDGDEYVHAPRIGLLSAHNPVEEPAVLLSSPKLAKLLRDLREKFDFIVINAPATLAVRDARAMGQFADQTIMVARWGRTTIEQMDASLDLHHYAVSGVIFDHVDYAEHARLRYGDSVQFYVDSSDYYSDDFQHPQGIVTRARNWMRRRRRQSWTQPEMA